MVGVIVGKFFRASTFKNLSHSPHAKKPRVMP